MSNRDIQCMVAGLRHKLRHKIGRSRQRVCNQVCNSMSTSAWLAPTDQATFLEREAWVTPRAGVPPSINGEFLSCRTIANRFTAAGAWALVVIGLEREGAEHP